MSKTIQGNTWLCVDCAELEPRYDTNGVELTNNYWEEEGIREFDNCPCGYCDTTLAGYRFRFAYWLDGKVETRDSSAWAVSACRVLGIEP